MGGRFQRDGWCSPRAIVHAADADQNVYLVGNFRGTVDFDPGLGVMNVTSSQAGAESSVYLSKLNSAGELQWVHTLDGRGRLSPSQLVLDGDGNLVIAARLSPGSNVSPMDVDPGPGEFLVQPIGSSGSRSLSNIVRTATFFGRGSSVAWEPAWAIPECCRRWAGRRVYRWKLFGECGS